MPATAVKTLRPWEGVRDEEPLARLGKGHWLRTRLHRSRAENPTGFKDPSDEQGDEGIVKETTHLATPKFHITNRDQGGKGVPGGPLLAPHVHRLLSRRTHTPQPAQRGLRPGAPQQPHLPGGPPLRPCRHSKRAAAWATTTPNGARLPSRFPGLHHRAHHANPRPLPLWEKAEAMDGFATPGSGLATPVAPLGTAHHAKEAHPWARPPPRPKPG